jgi:hypothetical protein
VHPAPWDAVQIKRGPPGACVHVCGRQRARDTPTRGRGCACRHGAEAQPPTTTLPAHSCCLCTPRKAHRSTHSSSTW